VRQSARISDMLEFVMFLINLKSKRVSLYKNWNPEKSDHMKEKKKERAAMVRICISIPYHGALPGPQTGDREIQMGPVTRLAHLAPFVHSGTGQQWG